MQMTGDGHTSINNAREDDAPEYHGYFVTDTKYWVLPTNPL